MTSEQRYKLGFILLAITVGLLFFPLHADLVSTGSTWNCHGALATWVTNNPTVIDGQGPIDGAGRLVDEYSLAQDECTSEANAMLGFAVTPMGLLTGLVLGPQAWRDRRSRQHA